MRLKILSPIFLLILLTIIGCKDPLDTVYDENEFQLNVISGDNQSGIFNQKLNELIKLEVTHPDGRKPDGYKILSQSEFGNFDDSLKVTVNGICEFEWELECGSTQSATFYLYGTECDIFKIEAGSCSPFDSIVVTASAEQGSGWVRACGIEGINIADAKFREFEDVQYILLDGIIYKSVDGGLNWENISTISSSDSPFIEMDIDDAGRLYAVRADNREYYLDEVISFWWGASNGPTTANSEITAYLIAPVGRFASFGTQGIYQQTSSGWNPVTTSFGDDRTIKKLIWHDNRIFGIIEQVFDGNENILEFISNTDSDFTMWNTEYINFAFYTNTYTDMISLPNGRIAITSYGQISEVDPDNGGAWNYVINPIYKFQNLNYLNSKIYFLSTNELANTSQIFRGVNGNYEDTNFPFDCDVIFFHVRDNGTYIVGCEDGIYVFN